MREIDTNIITTNIISMIENISVHLSSDAHDMLKRARDNERIDGSQFVLDSLLKNAELADMKNVPICQDTGICVVFLEIGDQVVLKGKYIGDAVNDGVRIAYKTLRKSVLSPITRVNTNDNTPAVIHYEIVKGDKIKMSVMLKGFGSENMSRLIMLPPSKGTDGVIDAIVNVAYTAQDKPCPPIILGVGLGGTAEKAMLMSKQALLLDIRSENPIDYLDDIEKECIKRINALKIGAGGMGGDITCLGVKIIEYPTHIASIPVGVTVQCHCSRHSEIVI